VARYRIDPDRSRVWIRARSTLHPIHSTTDGLEGYIDLEQAGGRIDFGAEPAAKLSFAVARLSSGNPLEDRELRRRIDARRYPTIDGLLTGIEPVGEAGRYRVTGDLAFRGVVRRCEDEMTLRVIDDETIQLDGQSTFDVRDFGMEPPRILLLRVEPDVQVRVEIVATREV
jgi:polyisoprenoid-binding protein YceI